MCMCGCMRVCVVCVGVGVCVYMWVLSDPYSCMMTTTKVDVHS